MEQFPRGICLIISNENFYENDAHQEELRRIGTEMDAVRLRSLFQKLHFHVEMRVNLRGCEMREEIKKLADEANLNADFYDAVCLIVLSHGTAGFIHGIDMPSKVDIDKVLDFFDDVLVGKPKLFIFQVRNSEGVYDKMS